MSERMDSVQATMVLNREQMKDMFVLYLEDLMCYDNRNEQVHSVTFYNLTDKEISIDYKVKV